MAITEEEARELCSRLLKADLDSIEFPGGKSRESLRVKAGDNSFILTKRKHLERAKLEGYVLRTLNQYQASVPRLIAAQQHYLIQQDVGGRRLSEALQLKEMNGDINGLAKLMESALASLAKLHQITAGDDAFQSIVELGNKDSWLQSFIKAPERLGAVLNLPSVALEAPALKALLRVEKPQLIKWDARPGNAIVRDNGSVIWIDWEHCGRRHPLDDLAWLMNDDFMPYHPELDENILARAIPIMANGLNDERALNYYIVFSVLHACIRLKLILDYQAKQGWWDFDYCLKFDKVGVVKKLALQIANRASNLSKNSDFVAGLSPWFDDVSHKIERRGH